jgi:hypothetical protein
MNYDGLWIVLVGLVVTGVAGYQLYSNKGWVIAVDYDEKPRPAKDLNEYIWMRYWAYSDSDSYVTRGAVFVWCGLNVWILGIVHLFNLYGTLYVTTIPLFCGLLFLTVGVLLRFSKAFNRFFWKYVPKSEKYAHVDQRLMSSSFLWLAFLMILMAYMFYPHYWKGDEILNAWFGDYTPRRYR